MKRIKAIAGACGVKALVPYHCHWYTFRHYQRPRSTQPGTKGGAAISEPDSLIIDAQNFSRKIVFALSPSRRYGTA